MAGCGPTHAYQEPARDGLNQPTLQNRLDRIKPWRVSFQRMNATAMQKDRLHAFHNSMQESEALSRRERLSSAAAVALGYTLAAGPVRAAAIKTGTDGLSAGMQKPK